MVASLQPAARLIPDIQQSTGLFRTELGRPPQTALDSAAKIDPWQTTVCLSTTCSLTTNLNWKRSLSPLRRHQVGRNQA